MSTITILAYLLFAFLVVGACALVVNLIQMWDVYDNEECAGNGFLIAVMLIVCYYVFYTWLI